MVWGKYLESVNERAECKCKGMVLVPKHACRQEGGGGGYTSYESQIACVFVREYESFFGISNLLFLHSPRSPHFSTQRAWVWKNVCLIFSRCALLPEKCNSGCKESVVLQCPSIH